MKRISQAGACVLFWLFANCCLPIASFAQAQPGSTDYVATSLTFPLRNPPQQVNINQVSVQLLDNPGPATYCYWIVSNYTIGNSAPAGPVCTTLGPNTLVNGIRVSWAPVLSANTYDVLRTSTRTPPSGACGCAIATAVNGISATDTGLLAYTVNTFAPGAFNLVWDNEQSAPGVSQMVLRANGTNIYSISSSGASAFPFLNSACNANQQSGADLGAKINTCLAVPNVSEIDITASGTISTQVVINNQSNLLIKGVGGHQGIGLTNGITGNPAACAIKITGTSQKIVLQDLNMVGTASTGNGVCVYGTGGTPSQITFVRFHSGFSTGNGIDGTGASMPAAGLYFFKTNTIQVIDGSYGGNQVGIEGDNLVNLVTISEALISGNLTSGILTKNLVNHWQIGPANDIINNGTGGSAKWGNLDGCAQHCQLYGNYIEGNNGLAAFTDASTPSTWDVSWNHWLHNGASASTNFLIDSSGTVDLDIHDNWFTSAQTVFGFIDFNPSASAGKVVRNNQFDFTAGTVTDGINWQPGTQTGKCVIENNTFGTPLNTTFTGTTAIDVSGGTTGCRVANNSCNTSSGTLSNCVKVEAGSTNTFVSNTTTSGAGTITNAFSDSGTNTVCIGQACAAPVTATSPRFSGTDSGTETLANKTLSSPTITGTASGNATLPQAMVTPGSNGQCLITTGGVTSWGTCAGLTAPQTNTTTVSVNASTTSFQNLQSVTFGAGVFNTAGKTVTVDAWGSFTPVNTTETVTVNFVIGGQSSGTTVLEFTGTPNSTATGWSFHIHGECTVTTTGATGAISCGSTGISTQAVATVVSGLIQPAFGGVSNINLTGTITFQEEISFTTASTSNTAQGAYLAVIPNN